MTMHSDNYGVQRGVAHPLTMNVPDADATYGIPVGYDITLQTGLADNGDGTFTVTASTWTAAPIEFLPTVAVAHEVTDTPGGTLTANTVDQSSL